MIELGFGLIELIELIELGNFTGLSCERGEDSSADTERAVKFLECRSRKALPWHTGNHTQTLQGNSSSVSAACWCLAWWVTLTRVRSCGSCRRSRCGGPLQQVVSCPQLRTDPTARLLAHELLGAWPRLCQLASGLRQGQPQSNAPTNSGLVFRFEKLS